MKLNQIIQTLNQHPIFNCLTEDQLKQLAELTTVIKKAKFNYVFHFDESTDRLFILVKGIVKTGNHSDDSREIIKSVLYPGAFFGELRLVGEKRRIEFAKSMNEEIVYLSLKNEDVKNIIRKNQQLTLIF